MQHNNQRMLPVLTFCLSHPFIILLLVWSDLVLPADAIGSSTSRGSSRSSRSSSSSGSDSGGGLNQAFTNMIKSWKFAALGLAIFGGLFALILVAMAGITVAQYYESRRKVKSIRQTGEAEMTKEDKGGSKHQFASQSRKEIQSQNQSMLIEEGLGNLQDIHQSPNIDKSNQNTGGAFRWLALAGSCFVLAYYPLFMVHQIVADGDALPPVDGLTIFTSSMADITIACAFLALMQRRAWIHFTSAAPASNPATQTLVTSSELKKGVSSKPQTAFMISSPRLKLALDVALAFSMVALTFANTVLACLSTTYTSEEKLRLLESLLQAYRLVYVLITIDVVNSAITLRQALAKARIDDKLISHTLCLCVCPLLGLREIFVVVDDMIRVTVPSQKINQDALMTVEVGMLFLCYTWALFNGLSGCSPKKSK